MAQTTGIAIGENASATTVTAIAIGDNAAAAANTVQLGNASSVYQLKVGSTQVVNASGKIPAANLDTPLPAEHSIVDIRTTGLTDDVKAYLLAHPSSFLLYGVEGSTSDPYIYAPCYRGEYTPARPPDYYYSLAPDEGMLYYISINWTAQPAQRISAGQCAVPTALSQLSADAAHRLVTDTEKSTWNAKYAKPSTGIPKTDLESAVQTSLGKADTALQSYTETDPEWTRVNMTATTVYAFGAATKLTLGTNATEEIQIGPTNGASGTKRGGTTSVGFRSKAVGLRSSAFGAWTHTTLTAAGSVAIGGYSLNDSSVQYAEANALRAFQLGPGTNSTADSLQFQSTPIVVGGKIPTASLEATATALTIHDWDGSQYVTTSLNILTA